MTYVPSGEEERRFLASYDGTKYKNPSVAADVALFAYDAAAARMYVLLIKRGGFPYRGAWALPGGFVNYDEDITAAAQRELFEETGVRGVVPQLSCVMADPARDPRWRIITPEFFALVDKRAVKPVGGDDAAAAEWFAVAVNESVSRTADAIERRYHIVLTGSETREISACARTEYGQTRTVRLDIEKNGGLAFDHAEALLRSLLALRGEIETGDMAYDLFGRMPSDEDRAALLASFWQKYEK